MSKELIEQARAWQTPSAPIIKALADRIEELEREVERKMSAADFILKERDALQADNARLREAMKEIRDDFDCDNDAHRYGSTCRCCLAEKTLAATTEQSLAASELRKERDQLREHVKRLSESLRDYVNADGVDVEVNYRKRVALQELAKVRNQ